MTAAREASARSPPAWTAAIRTGSAASAATWEASSGRGEEETPSQTTATTTRPSGVCSDARAIASSLRGCLTPRSLTPAAVPRSTSVWSREGGTSIMSHTLVPYVTLVIRHLCIPPSRLAAVHGDRGPGAKVDSVPVMQGYLVPGRYLVAVDERAVGRAGIQHRPAAVRHGDQHRVQPADAGVGGRAGQVDLRIQAPGHAPPPDPHLVAGEPEPPFGAVGGERHLGPVRAARDPDPFVVVAVGGDHYGPGDRGVHGPGHAPGGRDRWGGADRRGGRDRRYGRSRRHGPGGRCGRGGRDGRRRLGGGRGPGRRRRERRRGRRRLGRGRRRGPRRWLRRGRRRGRRGPGPGWLGGVEVVAAGLTELAGPRGAAPRAGFADDGGRRDRAGGRLVPRHRSGARGGRAVGVGSGGPGTARRSGRAGDAHAADVAEILAGRVVPVGTYRHRCLLGSATSWPGPSWSTWCQEPFRRRPRPACAAGPCRIRRRRRPPPWPAAWPCPRCLTGGRAPRPGPAWPWRSPHHPACALPGRPGSRRRVLPGRCSARPAG